MSDANQLLELIENGIVEHGGDLGGWTRRSDGTLQLFDGRVTLRAEFQDAGKAGETGGVHAHVFTTLHEHDDEVLDACIFGLDDNITASLSQAAMIWIMGVAGPIKSFIDNKPVCMTCQGGVQGGDTANGYSESDYGLRGVRSFVGPSFSRGIDGQRYQSALDDQKPWFRFAAESAAPRRVHLAKATVISKGKQGWSRQLEIDGHDVAYTDSDWAAGAAGPDFGYTTRFAVFEFPRNSAEITQRAQLENTIKFFAENYSQHSSIEALMQYMVQKGFDPDLVHEAESFSTIAFGRTLFENLGVDYSATIIRARRDGKVETDVPLMSLPAYTRARAIAARLRDSMPQEEFQALCLYNAESHVILQGLEAGGGKGDLSKMRMFPLVVPDRGVAERTMDAALAKLNELVEKARQRRKKPWWKFW